jgi:hypothetical protein
MHAIPVMELAAEASKHYLAHRGEEGSWLAELRAWTRWR